jgi:UDP-glucose 4-epimerase
MADETKAVAITGASGYIGSRLLRRLEDEEGIRKLVAIDIHSPTEPIHNMAAYRMDVAEPIDSALLAHRVTTLVHLAFITQPGRNRREVNSIRQTNLDTLRSVLESCVRAGVNHVVYLSSYTVYGAHPDNPIPITDSAPLRPLPDFAYGYDKYLSEQILQEFQEQHPDIAVTILRSCVVLGPSANNYVAKAFFRPWLLGVWNHNPPMQFVYEDDLARVLTIVVQQRLAGVFNVAGDGVVFYREMAEMMGSRLVVLPAFLAVSLTQLTWNLRIQVDSPGTGMALVKYPIVLSTGKLHEVTGYRFWHTSLETLTAFTNANLVDRSQTI